MALATNPLKGSCSTFPFVPSSWSRESKLKHCVSVFHAFGGKDRFISLKCKPCSCVGTYSSLGPKSKAFKLSAFKGSNQYDDSGSRVNSSKSQKNVFKVSYQQYKSEEVESSKVQNIVPSPHPGAVEATTRSQAIQNLFKNWLMLLRMPSATEAVEEVREEPFSMEKPGMPHTLEKRSSGILKVVWCYLLGLDASIKIPFLLFAPLYLAVNLVYGSKVSKELSPLWILGPSIVALNIKMFRAICGLYAFGFKQTVKIAPICYSLICDYIVHGKLKEASETFIFEPLAGIKNKNYNEVTRRILKDLQAWFVDRYLDLIESIWPFYCRTIRFLKRMHLI